MKQKLTIGLFLEHYEPFISGVITETKTLRSELERRGHTVYVVAPKVKGFVDKDKRIIRVPSIRLKALANTTVGLPSFKALRQLSEVQFDIIHSQEIFYCSALGLTIARRQGIPYVQSYHTLWQRFLDQYRFPKYIYFLAGAATYSSYPFFFGLAATLSLFGDRSSGQIKSFFGRLVWRHMLNLGSRADLIITPSRHLQTELQSSHLNTPVQHIPNGFAALAKPSPQFLPMRQTALRIISVARLSPEKRIDILLKAVAITKAELILVGDGPERPKLERLANQLKLGQRARFLGELANHQVRQLMRESDILALASYNFDNQPMVIIEALDAGLPIIYCDPKLTDGLTAANSLLVGKFAAGFSSGLAKLDRARLAKMAAASQRLAADYRISKIAEKIIAAYQNALKDYSSVPRR